MKFFLIASAGLKAAWGAWGSAEVIPEEVFYNDIAEFLVGDVHRWLQAGGSRPSDYAALLLSYERDCVPAGIGLLSPECVSEADLPMRTYRVGATRCCFGLHDAPNRALVEAARLGQRARVGLLLQDPRPRPGAAAANGMALEEAARRGHADVVQLLLNDGRANPTDQGSRALSWAAANGHAAVAQTLLDDGRLDPNVEDITSWHRAAIAQAAERGHGAVVRLLLVDGRADPRARGSEALIWAAANGHADVVELLLLDGRAEPAANDSESLRRAVWNHRSDVAQLLLGDGRADPTAAARWSIF